VGSGADGYLIRTYAKYQNNDYLMQPVFTPPATITNVPVWATSRANRVFGTDGTQFPRGIQDGQTETVYVSQLTRPTVLSNVNNLHVTFKGIDLVEFTIATVFMENATNNPLNADYYMYGFNGVANLTASLDPDFYVTKPHYLDTDPALQAQISGLSPNPALHDTFLDVEPYSGITMRGVKRLQLAIRLTPLNVTLPTGGWAIWGGSLPSQTAGLYMPVYWAEERGEILDSSASTFRTLVYGAQQAAAGIQTAGMALGVLFAVATCVLMAMAASSAAKEASSGTLISAVPTVPTGPAGPTGPTGPGSTPTGPTTTATVSA